MKRAQSKGVHRSPDRVPEGIAFGTGNLGAAPTVPTLCPTDGAWIAPRSQSRKSVWPGKEFLAQGAARPLELTCTCKDVNLPGGEYCAYRVAKFRRELDEHSAAELHYPH
jgi:hypothetical protein